MDSELGPLLKLTFVRGNRFPYAISKEFLASSSKEGVVGSKSYGNLLKYKKIQSDCKYW